MPESLHTMTWAMSDRAIPRSYRMMLGFGVHTFKLVNAEGAQAFVKFHWRPKLGMQSLVWDELIRSEGEPTITRFVPIYVPLPYSRAGLQRITVMALSIMTTFSFHVHRFEFDSGCHPRNPLARGHDREESGGALAYGLQNGPTGKMLAQTMSFS